MLTMMTRVKFADAAAEEGYTEILRKSLNPNVRGNVLEDRTRKHVEASEPENWALGLWAQDLRTEATPARGLPVSAAAVAGRGSQQLVEQDGLSEMLEEMSLSTLLYYVLAGEGRAKDESS
jgi:hypothetical protein